MAGGAVSRAVATARAVMPQGTPLPDADWHKRHGVISGLALLHAPVILVYALVEGFGLGHAVVETLPIAVAAVAGRHTNASRRVREVLTTLALVSSSAVLVHLSGGYIELHFHFFVIVALVTLYQQWTPFLVAIGFVLLHHGIAGAVAPASVYNHPDAVANPWGWAVVHAGFIAMASAVGLANWKLNELARHRAEESFRRLYAGEHALVERLREADRVKAELVAAVSHEFRTPLTSILGLAATLQAHPAATSDDLVDFAGRIHRQGRRLQQLVENLMQSERPLDAARGTCEAAAAVGTGVSLAMEGHRGDDAVTVDVEPDLELPLAADAAALVVTNLVSNALKFSTGAAAVAVRAHTTPDGAVLEVDNEGPEIAAHVRDRVFEPFVQGDSSITRAADGVGLGLHVARRIVAANDGDMGVRSVDGVTTFWVLLRVPSDDSTSTSRREVAVR